MSTISASTTTTTAFKVTSDTTGTLVLQTGSTPTTAVTIDTSGNFGIGTSSPGYKLEVAGSSYLNGNILTQANATLYNSTGDLFIRAGTSGALKLGAGGTNSLAILDTSGNLGLGTSSPSQKLNVSTASGNAYMRVERASQATGQVGLQIGGGTSSTDWLMYVPASSNTLTWFGNSTTLMSLDTSGNLGLGVTPSAWSSGVKALEGAYGGAVMFSTGGAETDFPSNAYYNGTNWIYKTSTFSARYSVNGYNGTHTWFNAASGTAGNAITFTQAMTLDASGNLGIGTSSPTTLVTMLGTTSKQSILRMQAASGGTGGFKRNTIQMRDDTGTAGYDIVQLGDGGNALTFDSVAGSTPTTRVSLDSSGNLLVGTTSTGTTNSTSLTLEKANGYMVVNHVSGTASGAGYAIFGYNGTLIGSITQSGTTAVLYNTTSDRRLKDNIIDADSASDLIDAIKVRQFDWKSDGTHQRYGMIAQELHKVAPEAVHSPADTDDMMAVDYSKLVPMLVKEIQSLRVRLNALESK